MDLDGPWIHEPEPLTSAKQGHGMLFRTFEGQLLVAVHSHRVGENGRYVRIPKLFEVDDSGDKIVLGKAYNIAKVNLT